MNESWEFFRISDLISFLSSSAKPLASYGRTGVAQTKTKAKKKKLWVQGLCSETEDDRCRLRRYRSFHVSGKNERSAFREALLIALPTSVREVDCIMLVLCKAFLKEQFAFFLEIRSTYNGLPFYAFRITVPFRWD